jgi:antitoxin HicB
MQRFIFPATFAPDIDGGYCVKFADIPEALTQGETIQEAYTEAIDCLEEAIANRIVMKLPIPQASIIQKGQYSIPLRGLMAAKAALYLTLRKNDVTKWQLSQQLHCDKDEVDRLIDPYHHSELPRIEAALLMLKQQLVIEVRAVA